MIILLPAKWFFRGAKRVVRRVKRLIRNLVRSAGPKYGLYDRGVYRMTRASGFFSELSTALFDLAKLGCRVREIDSARALRLFKDNSDDDLFAEIFERPRRRVGPSRFLRRELHHHSIYCRLPFRKISRITENWFTPVQEIQQRATALSRAFGVQPGEMIAVNLRGSKKYLEVEPTPVAHWVEAVSNLKEEYPSLTVVVASDDQDLVDEFIALADFRVVDLKQAWRTRNGESIVERFRDGVSSSAETKNFVAQTWLISRARILVTHTGNTAFWTSLFRGCHWGLFQFTARPGELVFSTSPCSLHSWHGQDAISIGAGKLVSLTNEPTRWNVGVA